MSELAAAVESLVGRVGTLHGEALELRYWRRAAAYFSRMARRLRAVDSSELADMLDQAVDAGRLIDAERDAILAADLVLSGQRRERPRRRVLRGRDLSRDRRRGRHPRR